MDEWLQLFAAILSGPVDYGLKTDVTMALTSLIRAIPKGCAKKAGLFLPALWTCLVSSADIYLRAILEESELPSDGVDEDGEILFVLFYFTYTLFNVN